MAALAAGASAGLSHHRRSTGRGVRGKPARTAAGAACAARAIEEPRRPAPNGSDRGLISCDHGRGRRFRLQYARPNGAGAERPHPRGSGQGNAAADAQDLARRQSPRHGRAPRARRDRAGLARTRVTARVGWVERPSGVLRPSAREDGRLRPDVFAGYVRDPTLQAVRARHVGSREELDPTYALVRPF